MEKTILVIEDNPDNMSLVQEILEDAGFGFVPAVRAEDGIEYLREKGGIDLVLMDVSLPDMDGIEATRVIRSDPELSAIPIMGLSAHAMASSRMAALEAGCNLYLTKPIDEDELLNALSTLLS